MNNRPMKRPIVEKNQIVTTYPHKYLELERRFNEYELARLSKPPGSYHLNLVHELFANYLDILSQRH